MVSDEPARPDTGATPALRGDEYVRAVLNILEDFVVERERLAATQRAVLNILDDAADERAQLESTQRAVLNILDDAADERARLEATQRATLNILDDFLAEKSRLEATQRAVLNILDDFEAEKRKVEEFNRDLRREVIEREAAQQALLRSNAELEQFAYVASHDLQEPLRMVSSYVDLFARRYQDQVDEQGAKYVRYAVDGARRMQALINGLLEYSRVGRQTQPGPVSGRTALNLALENLRSTIADSEAEIVVDELPMAIIDSGQFVQLFQNLLTNAIKFRRKEEPPRIHVRGAAGDDGFALFEVADNGIGIEPRHADRIFTIFQRLHTRTEYPGTGIGLSICKKVVERHGGRIWVESKPGKGATFKFTLPHFAGDPQ